MEEWEAVIKSCQNATASDTKLFAQVLKSTEIVLAEDLAPFETERVVSTLLNDPVQLLCVVAARRTDNDWAATVRDSLKLLASTVTKHRLSEKYYDDIVELCLLHYSPLAQQAALGCLAAVARRSAAGARGLRRHVASLEETATCKAPLATLIGTICEHHPSAVEDEVTRIWRVFLNLLDSNKYSVTVRKAILDGVRGLLTHFGAELPTRELNVLYEQLLAHLDHPKCEAAALQLLAAHARLFRERVAGDARVRALAWRSGARPAILALYGAAGEALAPDAFQKILDSEVSPRTRSARFYERYTALRVRALAGTGADATDAAEHADVRALQHRVRCGHVDWDTCEAVCWCIHARVPFSECVLQAAILCYERFPANKRKEVVVHSLLRADAELRSCTVKFLIAESVRAVPGAGWLRLWRDMFDDEDGRDAVVAECCDLVLDDVLHCVTDVLHSFVDDESSSDALARLLALVLDVLRAHPARVRRPLMARALRRRARTHAIAAPAAILLGLHLGVVYEDLPLHTCADEAMLLKFSEALLCAPDTLADKCPPRDLLTALEIIFSNNETEPALLSRAVQQLDTLLSDDSLDESDSERVRKIVVKLEKLTQFVGKKSKFERILHRDIVMFLGKHGQELAEPSAESDRMLIYNLQNSLVLDIPHNDGTIKLNLQAVLYAAIQREDLDALNMLLRVITANLSKTRERHILQTALIRVLLSLSHCGASSTAVSLCDASCAVDLFKYAVLEKSTRSRKILLDATEVLLRKDGQILENILECFLQNENDSMYQSSDIAIFILNQMKENNALSHQYLHTIIDKMIRVEASCDVIKMAADLYLDKCNQVDDLPRDVIKTLDSTKNDVKKCAVVVEFVKRLLEIRLSSETDEILDFILDVVKECDGNVNLTLFMGVTEVFGAERVKKAVLFDNLLEKILNTDCRDEYKKDFLHIKLDFYNTYSDVIQQAGQRCRIEDSEITIQNIIEYGEKLTKFLSDDTISVWFRHQPIDDITRSIERYDFKAEHEDCVRAMRVMLLECKRRDALPVVAVKCWAECVGRLDVANVGRSLPQQTAYLMDMLAVAFDYLSDDEILAIINKGDAGHQFLRTFMPAVFPRLTAEPYVLARGCSALLRDVLSCAASTDCRERVLGFVDALWPEFAQHSTTEQKLSALSALRPAPVHSRAARWALDAIASPHTSLQHKIVMLDVLPNDVKYSLLAKTLCPHLPARLDELTGLSASAFQTLLDALADSAYTGDTADTLLDTVVTVAAGGSEKGWWDDALDACMARVARRADARACRAVYARVFEGRSRGVCARLMEPLLRYSTPSFCEEFLSTVLEHLLSVLGKTPRQAGAHPSLERCCLDHVRALRLLRLAFQQVPKDHIESPKSVLYSKMNIDKPWYLVSAVGKLCVTLRTSVKCPPDADAGMKESYRMFQCENYNALAAAVCCTSLKPAMVGTVFSRAAWDLLIGDEEIQLPLRQPWNQQSTRHALSIEVSGELRARTLATSTMRTQAFAGTLSENVLQYDLAEPEEEVEVQELHLADNALNAHACAATLTALLSRLSAVQAPGWRQELVSALCSARRNVRWLLAQAVCNSKEDLQPHASALRPALLDVIVTTAHQKILNGLHMDILDTLIHWNQTSTEPSEQITKTIDCLVTTATQYRLKKDLYYMVLEKMTRMLTLHTVTIDWDCFETCLADPTSDTAKCHLDILTRIAKCKVLVPQLLPALRHAVRPARAVPELIALLVHAVAAAVHTGGNGEGEWMQFYRRVLSQLRGVDTGGYIRLLYEAQKSFQNSCDDTHFRWVVDLTPKVAGRARLQCLAVLAAHAEHAQHVRAEHVASMFDTVGIDDLLDKREALLLVKNGLHLMEHHQRRRLVLRVAGACRHLPARERAVAYGALLRAFQLLLTEEPSEPEPKRRAQESNSLLLSKRDDYSDTVLAGVAQGLMERDADIANSMREGVGRCLSEDCGVRLCESFLLCVAPPSDLGQPSDVLRPSGGGHLARVVELFFRRVRDQAPFQRAGFSDELVLEQVELTAAIRTVAASGVQRGPDMSETRAGSSVSMDDVLTSVLALLEKDTDAATSVVIQLVASHRAKRPGFDPDATMSRLLLPCLQSATIAPWVISVAREINIWDSTDLEQITAQLMKISRNTEGEGICRLLYEEYRIRRPTPALFVLGMFTDDVDMPEPSTQFSLKNMISCFGSLSNWDDLTSQRRASVRASLPPLWTTGDHFDAAIEDDITNYPTWVKAMVSARRDSERDTFAWLTELQRWPKKPFDISAVMETSTWDRIGVLPEGQSPALPLHIRPSDCLAEWAFRIMMRSSYLQSVSLGSNEALDKLSHSHQLRWCASANERGLHEQALLCCKSVTGLYRSESLSWLRQKLVARRALALAAHDAAGLSKALESAETYTKQFREDSSFDDVMGMNELILRLKRDVQSSREDFNNTFKEITNAPRPPQLSPVAKQHLEAAYVTAITFTNNLWDTCQQHEKSDLLHSMTSQLTTFVQLQLGRAGVLLADVIIARLAEDVQPTPNTRRLLDTLLELMKHQLDEVSLEQLSASAHKSSDAGAHRRRLSALVQPDYQLQQYCLRSRAALDRHDDAEWSRAWAAMKEAIFDNEFAGADFQVLYKYKDNIDAMAESSTEVRRQLLTSILADLKVSERSTLYLSHLCPSLARVPQRDEGLARLLRLKKGVYVVRFEEKISVFVKSLRRPALVRCVLSDGSSARFIVKSGERARPHCVALRMLRAAQASGVRRRTGYHVSALSEECALVQYLEDCVTLRALLGQRDLVPPQRTKDSELILSPQRAAAQFAAACDSVPAHLLRSAIEATCVSVQDFITKRRNFLESLCDMTVLSYLCGIGDRHLENILYSIKDGGACHVDCGTILSFGAGTELPPARLTRNVLAVCDYTALEGRLQCMLTCIRDLRELLVPSIAVAGKWLKDDRLMDKLRHVQALVRGGAVSHRLTALLLSQSDERHRHEYIDLLRLVFADFPLKDTYSVEEQVSSLLRQSTDPLILGVTRSGWEPWI